MTSSHRSCAGWHSILQANLHQQAVSHNRVGYVSATPSLLLNTPSLECFAHPVGTWGKNTPTVTTTTCQAVSTPARHRAVEWACCPSPILSLQEKQPGLACWGSLSQPIWHVTCLQVLSSASPHHNLQCMFLTL